MHGFTGWVVAGIMIVGVVSADEPLEPQYDPRSVVLKDWFASPAYKQLAAAPQKITTTVSGITFDSDYDNGSLLSVVAGANSNTFTCDIYEEQGAIGPRKYWFRFRMTGGAGRTVTLNIPHSDSRYPWYRVGTGPWTQMSTGQAPTSNQIVLVIPASSAVMEVAFYSPYGYQETLDAVQELIEGHPYAHMEVIGQSTQGRDVHMITIDDTTLPAEDKQRVWVHTRAHAGEVTATHSMLGLLEQLTEDSPTGARLRRYGIYHIVPQYNVDGIWLGHTRWTSLGIDPEREWCNVTMPEALAIKAQIDGFMQGPRPLKIALNLHSTVGTWTDTFFFNHVPGPNGVLASYTQHQRNYIEALRDATSVFDDRNPQTSNLADCIFVESYFYDNWNGSVMAITHEGHYSRRWYDGAYATAEDHREVGRGMARAVSEFLNFPNPPHGWYIH